MPFSFKILIVAAPTPGTFYNKVDKPASENRLKDGQAMTDTEVYKELSSISDAYSKDARLTMQLGGTDASRSFQSRWKESLEREATFAEDTSQRQDQLRFNQN